MCVCSCGQAHVAMHACTHDQGVYSFFKTKYQDNIKNIKTNFIEISRHFSHVSQFSHNFVV